ncbi:SusC/RagA family TonB-linked outer membrane protein [Myroides sp. N17-2]|uniref:SusC/RagA family TonB-linked outer membrane protein n=1 Tax=Myroides sp. N17-2 TaxID=2030799 RepID=UPI000EFAFBF5|nr:SusC/RagA family TonB-linked outer membrane protein [Myroides sp. N17-2]
MKTQILIFSNCRTAMSLIFLVGLLSCPIYAVSNDKHLFFNVSDLLQDTKQKPTIKLSGTVKDSFGALGGVIVTVGTKVVTTDLEGKYTTYITSGDKITFSMMGYKDQSIVYTGGSSLNITLSEDNNTLDEIVVNAGYYTVKDRERTGSIARVTAKDIEFQPVTNPLQAIQGRMAGVSITQNSGVPGGGFDIQIRGRNSLRKHANSPLYIIDGIVINNDSESENTMSNSILPGNNISPINFINPNNIESIEILKDADATAIYGSRGANGVVLITTKKGKSDNLSFTLSSSTAFSKVANKMKLLNTEQFNRIRDQAFINDEIKTFPSYEYDMNGTWDRYRYTDWQKELIGGTAISKNISFNVAGGNENTHFLVGVNYSEETTVFPTSNGYKRTSFNSSLSHNSKDHKFNITIGTNYTKQYNNLLYQDLTSQALTLAPNAPALYNSDGTLNWQNGTFENPLALSQKTYDYKSDNLLLNVAIGYQIFPNVSLKLNTGTNLTYFTENQLTPHTIHNPSKNYTSEISSARKGTSNKQFYIIEPQVNWNYEADQSNFNILIGTTFQQNKSNNLYIRGTNFPTNALMTNIGSAKNQYIDSNNQKDYRYTALFFRLNYIYDSKYIVNLTGRRDGSSRFGKNNQFGNFGAIAGAWLFSEENLFNSLSWLSFGKLRASYGTTGSDNIGDYQYLDTYSITKNIYDKIIGLTPTNLYNPNFGWEKTTKLESSIDISLFNNRINTSISWYRNRTSNQLVGIPLAGTTGFSSVQSNLNATVQNTGWEYTLQTNNIQKKDWTWSTSFNISFPKNKLISFPGLEGSTYANQYVIGESTSIRKVYQYEGLDPTTGIYKFKDFNQDSKYTALDDKQTIKDIAVKYYGGLQNSIAYKNFHLDFLFHFVKQTNLNYNYKLILPGALANQPIEVLDSWSIKNQNASYAPYSTGENSALYQNTLLVNDSDYAISDASFIRLKNISLSYNLAIPNSGIKSINIYFQGQNLLTITKYFGLDPEFTSFGYLPPLKTYAFGFQLTL